MMENLTSREVEVMDLISEGWSNAAICSKLFFGKRSVEHHINNIFGKLDVSTSSQYSYRVKATLIWASFRDELLPEPKNLVTTVICIYCYVEKVKLIALERKRIRSNRAGPYCSRSCAGKAYHERVR